MKDGKFKCPYCGSTHFEHVFPKKKKHTCIFKTMFKMRKIQILGVQEQEKEEE